MESWSNSGSKSSYKPPLHGRGRLILETRAVSLTLKAVGVETRNLIWDAGPPSSVNLIRMLSASQASMSLFINLRS